jgi:hypothetical protein
MPGKGKESRWLLVGDEVAPSASSIKGRVRRTLPDAKSMGKGRFLAAASGQGRLVCGRLAHAGGITRRDQYQGTRTWNRERKVLRYLLVFGCWFGNLDTRAPMAHLHG